MTSSRRALILVPLLLLSFACQAVMNAVLPPTPTPLPPTFTKTPTQRPSETPIPTLTGTPTLAPTATETLAPTATLTASPQQLQIFEELWHIVNEEYLYPDFNGLDWGAIYEEYRQLVESGLSDADFYLAMDEMILRLGDDHSVYLSPQEVAEEEAIFAGENDYVGVGILVSAVPERDRAVVLVTFPDSPAEQAGLKPRDSLLAAGGEPILDEDGNLRDIVRGPEGSAVELTIQSPGESPRQVSITRARITGSVPIPSAVLTTPGGLRVGYLLLVTFSDTNIDEEVERVLQEMSQPAPLDGLIIDNRQNEGGADDVLKGTLAYFTDGLMGNFISRTDQHPLIVRGSDVSGSQTLPLVVLVGENTVSFGEIFAGILKDIDRAQLIGQVTLGNVETLWGYEFSDGSRAWIAHDTFQPLNHPQDDWEESGIIPHQVVPANWDEYTLDSDPVVEAALEYFDQRTLGISNRSHVALQHLLIAEQMGVW